jgi:hypothetical protein
MRRRLKAFLRKTAALWAVTIAILVTVAEVTLVAYLYR